MKLESIDQSLRASLFEFLLRLGDDALIMGHRLSEWCGHGPILEEDIALSNIALDHLGHAAMFLRTAGVVEGKGRDEDALAFLRGEREFRNLQLVEQPKGDYACTITKLFLFSTFQILLLESLSNSPLEELAAIAAKAVKEVRYHVRHSSEWIVRFGDGTSESRGRIDRALNELWPFTLEFFESDPVQSKLVAAGIISDLSQLESRWTEVVGQVLTRATVATPAKTGHRSRGSRLGLHTEHLGHLLSEMQTLPRSFPGARW